MKGRRDTRGLDAGRRIGGAKRRQISNLGQAKMRRLQVEKVTQWDREEGGNVEREDVMLGLIRETPGWVNDFVR